MSSAQPMAVAASKIEMLVSSFALKFCNVFAKM